MDLDDLLGIDATAGLGQRARRLRDADRKLVADLTKRRKDLKLSQEEVARRMDTSQSTVARIEAGTRDLHQSTLRRYAMAVEVVVEHVVLCDDDGLDRSRRLIQNIRDQIPMEPVDEFWNDFNACAPSSRSLTRTIARPADEASRV